MKSGGHITNPGFSSTEGIHIYTGRFSQVTYDAVSSTAVIGTGLVWDTVYERLQEYGVTVLGARVTGVSGSVIPSHVTFSTPVWVRLALAASCLAAVCHLRCLAAPHTDGSRAGYSYKTNQYGLAIDTVVGFNLVLPNGTIESVTQSTHPDLFAGLKGGFNNFVSCSPNTASPGLTHCIQGIVTDFTMATFPQTEVWVRVITFSAFRHNSNP